MKESEELDREEEPPILTGIIPLELAAWFSAGGRPPDGHPLAGVPIVFLDLRESGDYSAERINGSLNVPTAALDDSLKKGELSKLDRAAVILAFGSKWPHFEVVSRLRGADGFQAVYAMEGLDSWRHSGFPLIRDERLQISSPRQKRTMPPYSTAAEDPHPLPGLDALALKTLLDARIDILCIFVGDRRTYEAGHVPGAVHVPASEIVRYLDDASRDRLIVVLCGCCQGRRGGPSEKAVRLLRDRGFSRVLHMDGHMQAWKTAGLPVEVGSPPLK